MTRALFRCSRIEQPARARAVVAEAAAHWVELDPAGVPRQRPREST